MDTVNENQSADYSVDLSQILNTIIGILPHYSFEDRSETLNVSYFDEMNHSILMDLAACLVVNYNTNPDLSWMRDFNELVDMAYTLSEKGSFLTENFVKDMYTELLFRKPENFDCRINDNYGILYDLYHPDSDSSYKEN
jgi:hypothetical protein